MINRVLIVLTVLLIASSSTLYIFNDPPDVIVETSPAVYSGIPFGWSDEYDLEDLIVKVYASDPDGDDIQVLVMFGFRTWEEFALDTLYDYREQLGLMVKTEMALTANEVYLVGHVAMDQIASPEDAPHLTTPWYELVELAPGYYQISVDLNQLDVDGQLKGVDVYVNVYDENKRNTSDEKVYVPIYAKYLPDAANLLTPPANPDYICPPQPIFSWSWPKDEYLGSYQFRLAKGKENVWERSLLNRITSMNYSWTCDLQNECSGDYAPDHIFITNWTPPEPLKAGIYSWGIVASDDTREQKFNPPEAVRSPSFQFTVDSSLNGHECVRQDYLYPSELGQSEEQDGLVEVPNIVGLYVSDMNEFMDDIPLKFITLSDDCPLNRKLIIYQEPKSGEMVERMSILEGFTTCERKEALNIGVNEVWVVGELEAGKAGCIDGLLLNNISKFVAGSQVQQTGIPQDIFIVKSVDNEYQISSCLGQKVSGTDFNDNIEAYGVVVTDPNEVGNLVSCPWDWSHQTSYGDIVISICPSNNFYYQPYSGEEVIVNGNTPPMETEPEATKTPTQVPDGTYLGNSEYRYELYYSEAFSKIPSPYAPLMIVDPLEGLELVGQQYLSGTNLKHVHVGIGASSNSSIITSCIDYGEDEIINSIPYKKVEFSEAGGGSVYWQINYRTLQKGACYEIGFVIAYGNMDMYASGSVVEFDKRALLQEINQLLSTFSIME